MNVAIHKNHTDIIYYLSWFLALLHINNHTIMKKSFIIYCTSITSAGPHVFYMRKRIKAYRLQHSWRLMPPPA